ncbi:MAG: ABC transporter ATP-binding protein [Candidatus Rokubacteria bacterium]|nr:ABC transporter ATP-binding protein [Candidatus Rokubacteria bacterium]
MASVRLTGLSKRFGPEVTAVRDLTLEVRHGEVVSLLGPSGCGKTTTLRLVAGFLEPDAGEIRVGERRLSGPGYAVPPERRGMSMIFQSYAVWPHRTVAENVGYGLRFRDVPRAEVPKRVRDALALVRLEALADRYPGELSGGQQQRVALARALVVEPEILLLDEPLSNLDANLREEMRFEIRRLHEELQITTLYVTHDQAEAMVTSDRIAVMREGRVEQVGTAREVYEQPATAFVAGFVGRTNLLHGVLEAAGRLRLPGGVALRVQDARGCSAGADVAISIRPHRIAVASDPAALPDLRDRGWNVLAGTVTRVAYFGDALDVQVSVAAGGPLLRLSARPEAGLAVDQAVTLLIPPEACVPLPPA